jgi:hypothetical protein
MPASSTIQFAKTTLHDTELGKLEIPTKKIAAWINFLVSPRQQAQIISAEQQRSTVTLMFQAPEELYTYLDCRINGEGESSRYRAQRSQSPTPVAS